MIGSADPPRALIHRTAGTAKGSSATGARHLRSRRFLCPPEGAAPPCEYPYEGKFPHELHPQVATVEISDAELDNVSGGLAVNALGTVTGLVDGVAPVSGLVNTAVGTVEGATGLNTAPVTDLVAGV